MFSSKSVKFDPSKDIPDLTGKVIIVTGGTNGLGLQSALEFARHGPAHIYIGARNVAKGQDAVESIRSRLEAEKKVVPPITVVDMDLASLDSVRAAALKLRAELPRLDILMLNAGIMAVPPGLTKDGFEIQFGTNHVGHFLLTQLLMPVLERTAAMEGSDVRIVVVSSYGHTAYAPAKGIDFDSLRSADKYTPSDANHPNAKTENLGPYGRYGQSKLANVLFALSLTKRHPKITSMSLHPGVVSTGLLPGATATPPLIRVIGGLVQRLGLLTTVEEGVKCQLWCAVGEGVKRGTFYMPIGVTGGEHKKWGKDEELAEKLWTWSEEAVRPWID